MERLASYGSQLALRLPGTALAAVIGLAAMFVASVHGGPQLLYALFFGIALHHLSLDPRTRVGIEFCAQGLLRLGVGLLGARITASQISAMGWTTAALIALAVATTLGCGLLLGRRLGLSRAQGLLAGGAVGICGASAALAISAVLPREKNSERFTLLVIVTVTVLSTITMVLYPLVAKLLALPDALAGVFLGGTIHDVAQVVGAGYMLNEDTGDAATVVKLFRVAMLPAVVLATAMTFRDASEKPPRSGLARALGTLPWFLWLFIGLIAVNSSGYLPPAVQDGIGFVARACLILAIAALGVKTSLRQLAGAGWRPLVLLTSTTVWLGMFVLAGVAWLR